MNRNKISLKFSYKSGAYPSAVAALPNRPCQLVTVEIVDFINSTYGILVYNLRMLYLINLTEIKYI